MREIKFRAWDEKKGKYDYFTQSNIAHYITEWSYHSLSGTELEQYTGLKDKNGKEIYEGDIVSFEGIYMFEPVSITGRIVFGIGLGLMRDEGEGGYPAYYIVVDVWRMHMTSFHDYEITGNIHENPEILHDTE